MANDKNLIPNSERTPSELREIARKGGEASGETRRRKKLFREQLMEALETEQEDTLSDGTTSLRTLKEMGAAQLAAAFARGNLRAIQLVLEVIGEAPVSRMEVTGKDGLPLMARHHVDLEVLTAEQRELLLSIGTEIINRKE